MDAYDVYIAKLRQDQDALYRLRIRTRAIRGMSDLPEDETELSHKALCRLIKKIHEEAIAALGEV